MSPDLLDESTPRQETAPLRRSRLVAGCALLLGLALVQDPGLLVADTKFDLVADPLGWLARSLHVWDGEGGFGQVQNQAHGYLWPMGPFFALLHAIDVPGWVVQRLWQALVMGVAFVGAARLVRALGVRAELACLLPALAYALSPRMFASLGPISIEVWPSALAPWVLLPLVVGARSGSPRRAAALSGLAVAMVGGVNAAASFAVVPLAAVWILTRTPGPRRRALMLWWPVFAALGTLWWIVPLLVMGAVSPPFLDFTETSALTTFPTTIFDTLRGTTHWVPYIDPASRAGHEVITTSWLAINTAVVVVVGLVGLLDRRTPHRIFGAVGLLLGVLLVTAGHDGAVHGWFAGDVAAQLDGVLAPLRNVHKFDPVVRIPLIIGLAFALDRLLEQRRSATGSVDRADRAGRAERLNASVLVGAVVLGVVGSATPALAGRLEPTGAMLGVPDYWRQVADHVARRSGGGTTLVLPGSTFAEYLWGDPRDEPMQWLAGSRWAVRSAGILAEPGQIRMLDGLERRIAEGHGSAGLTEALRRAGVEQLVVRNDLRPSDDVPSPALVHQALADSPGIVRVAGFGPRIGGDPVVVDGERRTAVDSGRQASYRAVEVFSVRGAAPAAAVEEPTVVAGGSDDLADLADAGVIGRAPVRMATDVPDDTARPRRVVLTDGLRERERQFARMHDGASATLTPGDVRRIPGPTRDVLPPGDADGRWSTTARLDGVAAVVASSAASDADAPGGSDRGRLAFAATDGSTTTSWSSTVTDPAPTWRVRWDDARPVASVTVTVGPDAERQRLRVRTAAGVSRVVEIGRDGTRRIALPGTRPTRWVQVERVGSGAAAGPALSLAEVTVPGLRARRVLDLPRLPEGWGAPDVVALRADRDGRSGCVRVAAATRCAAGTARTGEDGPIVARGLDLGAGGDYDLRVTARPRAGASLDALVQDGLPGSARASSLALADPRAAAVAAVDGDPSTAWLAAPGDARPRLELSWLGRRTVSGITLALQAATAAPAPRGVTLTFRDGPRTERRDVLLDADGSATFEPVRASGVEIVTDLVDTFSDPAVGSARTASVGIGEVRLDGVGLLPLVPSSTPRRWACGTGPAVEVAGRRLATALVASPRRLAAGLPVPAEVCGEGPVALPAGRSQVVATASPVADVETLTLTATTDPGEPAPLRAALADDGAVARRVGLVPGPGADEPGRRAVVALRESANRGWVGRQDVRELDAVVLDGWQQGFVTVGPDPVEVRFAADRPSRLGLGAGLLLVPLLLLGLRRPRPRTVEPPPLDERRLAPVAGALAAFLVAGLTTGAAGVVVLAVVAAGVLALRRRPDADDVLPWLLAAPVLLVGVGYALRPWAGASPWAGTVAWWGYLALAPVVALPLLASRSADRGPRRMPSLRRIAGRSTTR